MALSPMMQQYMAIKEANPGCIILYRLGDFYEMFFEDAQLISRELGLTLTGRDCGLEERAPMCGVPYHSVDTYIAQMIALGHHVAICEQLEDPAAAKGIVKRGIVRIITPGTVTDETMLPGPTNNYLLALCEHLGEYFLTYCDISTGEIVCDSATAADLPDTLSRIAPTEIVCDTESAFALTPLMGLPTPGVTDVAKDMRKAQSLVRRACPEAKEVLADAEGCYFSCALLFEYLERTQKTTLLQLDPLVLYTSQAHMVLDTAARQSLELLTTLNGQSKGSLFHLLNKASCAMGQRTLKNYIINPLCDQSAINARLDAVEELCADFTTLQELHEVLGQVYDIERLVTKLSYGSLNARDALALRTSALACADVKLLCAAFQSPLLQKHMTDIDPLSDLCELIGDAISEKAPVSIKEGGILRDGYSPEVDRLRHIDKASQDALIAIETREREATGIKTLRTGYNRVFGYYIEVPRTHTEYVPYTYTRKQTVSNAERYISQELKDLEQEVLGAREAQLRLEYEIFCEIRQKLLTNMARFKQTAGAVKHLDALCALALCAQEYGYCRPQISTGFDLAIEEGRHPVVEDMLRGEFVPNDAAMTSEESLLIITGPNMAGKSTYMRQVALIVLMAHIGSFVPAASATIPLTDRIFTRIGARDNLSAGQSTFMVEMSELSNILQHATSRSLILLDEVGRGTSTFDGLAIAWACVEHIANEKKLGAKTLFATHYHELSQLEGHLPGVVNYRIAVREKGEQIVFLRKIMRGGSDRSFGVQVARLAGLPQEVIARAMEIMAKLETEQVSHSGVGSALVGQKPEPKQLDITQLPYADFVDEISKLDINAMTPMEALNTLYLLRERAKKL